MRCKPTRRTNLTATELAVREARADFIEHRGHLSLIGSSRLEEAGLSPEYFERLFESENHNFDEDL